MEVTHAHFQRKRLESPHGNMASKRAVVSLRRRLAHAHLREQCSCSRRNGLNLVPQVGQVFTIVNRT